MNPLNLIDRAHLFIDELDRIDFGRAIFFTLDISSSSDYIVIHMAHNGELNREDYIRILDVLYEYFTKVDHSIRNCYIDEDTDMIVVERF